MRNCNETIVSRARGEELARGFDSIVHLFRPYLFLFPLRDSSAARMTLVIQL